MSVLEEIRQFVSQELMQGSNSNIGADDPLIEDGYLTSLQTVELVMFIEEKFQVEIEPELVDEQNFRTLNTVASLVEGKLNSK
jgi:acyl carrier protein